MPVMMFKTIIRIILIWQKRKYLDQYGKLKQHRKLPTLPRRENENNARSNVNKPFVNADTPGKGERKFGPASVS